MSQKNSIIMSAGVLLLLFVLYMMGNNAKKAYVSQKSALERFESQAHSLATLKEKFGDKNAMNRTLKTLERIAPVSKDLQKSSSRLLMYDNISATTLGNLLRKIENSTLNIKKLEIHRINENSASLHLEIKK